jgi:hypothetical protein
MPHRIDVVGSHLSTQDSARAAVRLLCGADMRNRQEATKTC